MNLIHTAELNHIAPFDYLVALRRHAMAVAANPADWMPWTYHATLGQLSAGPDPPK
jgi:transposase